VINTATDQSPQRL